MNDPLRIDKLRPDHKVDGFDCGHEELNRFLARFALINQRAGAAQTYAVLDRINLVQGSAAQACTALTQPFRTSECNLSVLGHPLHVRAYPEPACPFHL